MRLSFAVWELRTVCWGRESICLRTNQVNWPTSWYRWTRFYNDSNDYDDGDDDENDGNDGDDGDYCENDYDDFDDDENDYEYDKEIAFVSF